jgi:class 3 adenylate cyclase/TolB-like protein
MGSDVAQRRLAAIVVADVAGYSRLMERDETGTHARLQELRALVIEPSVARHGGRVVNVAGDGFLIEFGSAAAALRCSIDVQGAMLARNRAMPVDDRIEFRFGIHLGDIIVDGNDIAGDGINVASRVQALAEAGGICVSAAVREQVHGGFDVQFLDIGERHVKNIGRPIRTYSVTTAVQVASGRYFWRRFQRRGRWRVVAGVVATSAVVVVGPASFSPQATAVAQFAGPPLLSVAVLPFAPGEGIEMAKADELTQDLTTAIERSVRPARVVSHGMAAEFASDRRPHDPRSAGAHLNVRYVVEGNMIRTIEATDMNVRLIDTASGAQVWSDRVSTSRAFPQSDAESVAELADHVTTAMARAEARRIAPLPKSATEPIDRVLRGNALWHRDQSLSGTLAARTLYEEALKLDPLSAPALIGLGYTLHMQLVDDPAADRERILKEMDDISRRAVRADSANPNAWLLRGNALSLQLRRNEAFEANAAALRIDPYLVAALQDQAGLLTSMGQPDKALELLERARSANSSLEAMQTTFLYTCRAHIGLGNHAAAIDACERTEALGLDWWYVHFLLTAAYAQTGDMTKSAEHRAMLLAKRPDMSIERFKSLKASDDPAYLAQTEMHLINGLRKAGLVEN